ncbi:hypothetical protein ACJX0J_013103, partial [Zea mays]
PTGGEMGMDIIVFSVSFLLHKLGTLSLYLYSWIGILHHFYLSAKMIFHPNHQNHEGKAYHEYQQLYCEQCSLKMTNIRNYLKIVVVRVYYIANMKNYVGLFSMLYVNLYTQMTSLHVIFWLFSLVQWLKTAY